MIETPARVTRLEGNSAWVVSMATSSCGACGGKGCGSSLFARFWHAREPEYPVDNTIGAEPGEAVVVGLPDGALLHAALSSYGMPLLLTLLGAGAGNAFFGEPGSVAGGLFGLLLAGLWLKLRGVARAGPVILRRGDVAGGQMCKSRGG